MNLPGSTDVHAPYRVFKSDVSYFSGKLEAYMRYKDIPHECVDVGVKEMAEVAKNTGIQKIPAVKTADNQWLFDTTPMIQWFEQQYTSAPVLPDDPALRFLALLLEDYGDEWLWRPAMWWRWVPRASRWALGWRIAAETVHPFVARPVGWLFGDRQHREWLWGDGMNRQNEGAIRDMLYRELEFLEPLLEQQPYLLGSHPCVADFGYFGPMYRHFGNDPESAEVVRRYGPNTYEWLARLWNAKIPKLPQQQIWVWPQGEHWAPLLQRIAQDYLPYLHQNALAFAKGRKRFDYTGNTFSLGKTRTTNYRVYCREVLQQEFNRLPAADQNKLEALFEPHGGLSALQTDGVIASNMAEKFVLPRAANPDTGAGVSLLKLMIGQPRN